MTSRRIAGAFLVLLGAVGVTASAYLNWYDGRPAEHTPLDRLFQADVAGDAVSYWTSVAVPLALVTFVTVVGLLLQSRLVVAVGWMIGLGTLVLFTIMQSRDATDFSIGDLQSGAWVAVAGLALIVLGVASMGPPPPEPVSDEPLTVMQTDRFAPAPPAPGDTATMGPAQPAEPYGVPEPSGVPDREPYPNPGPYPEPEPQPHPYPGPEPVQRPEDGPPEQPRALPEGRSAITDQRGDRTEERPAHP